MKRIYKKRKSSEIKEHALKQLRETRAMIEGQSPDLLKKMQDIIGAMDKEPESRQKPEENSMVEIDRQKNLETVLRFIELKPHSDNLKQELKKLLT